MAFAGIQSTNDYYPFGSQLPHRGYDGASYKFGFNGKEKDDEVSGVSGTKYDYGFRIYDSRICRFLSVDPLFMSYPWYTPYQFAGNMPIWAIDLDGLEELKVQDKIFFGETYLNINWVYPDFRTPNSTYGTDRVDYLENGSVTHSKASIPPNSPEGILYNQYNVKYYKEINGNFQMFEGPVKDALGNYKTPPNGPTNAYSVWRGFNIQRLDNTTIFFQNDRSSIDNRGIEGNTAIQIAALRRIGQLMANDPGLIATVGGYTDSDAGNDYNTNLSQKRINCAIDYLKETYGIERSRFLMSPKGEEDANPDRKVATDRKVEINIFKPLPQ